MLDRTALTFPNDTSVMQQMCVMVTVMVTLATPDIFHGSNVNMIILDNDDFFIRLITYHTIWFFTFTSNCLVVGV